MNTTLEPQIIIQLIVDGVIRGSMYGLMGMGMALVFGIMGLINFAHGEFFMIGAYLMYWIAIGLGLPPIIGVLAAAAFLFLLGVTIERGLIVPLRKRLGHNWSIDGYVLTIGLLILLQNLALILFGAKSYGMVSLVSGRLILGGVIVTYERLLILAIALTTVISLALFLSKTFIGRSIRATAEHPVAAQALGIDIRRTYTFTFGLSAAIVGAVGALLISMYPASPFIGSDILLKAFIVVVIGGLGNVWGAMLAGPLLGIIESFSTVYATGGWQNAIAVGIVLLVLIIRPSGLFSKRTTRP